MKNPILAITLLAAACTPLAAQVRITEVAPWASGSSPYMSDWFELTNTGSGTLNIAGWKMDDNSNNVGNVAVALNGITTIAAGESVIFTETAVSASFLTTWFGANPPAGLQTGTYTGSGVGLSATADAVNIYDGSNTLQANVSFGTADATSPFQSFDNAAGLNNATISALSASGTNGAFVAAGDAGEIGSPGAVPEPSTYAMLGVAGLFGAVRFLRRRRTAC